MIRCHFQYAAWLRVVLLLLMTAGSAVATCLAQTTAGIESHSMFRQPRIDLYLPGEKPNIRLVPKSDRRGRPLSGQTVAMQVSDSIVGERIWRTSAPRLYYYPANPSSANGTCVLVIPGGGYDKQAFGEAGVTTAHWLNALGITAFVLIHRMPDQPDLVDGSIAPLQDAQQAVRYIRCHAEEYGIRPGRIGVMGCSAGGHVSACVSTMPDTLPDGLGVPPSLSGRAATSGDVACRPDFAILVSPVISMADGEVHRGSRATLLGARQDDPRAREAWSVQRHVTALNPPTLLIHASDDPAVSPMNSVAFYQALMRCGVSQSSLHVFPFGKHSIAVRRQPGSTALWPEIAECWMREIGVLE